MTKCKIKRNSRLIVSTLVLILALLCSSCKKKSREEFIIPSQGESELTPVESYYVDNNYDNTLPTIEKTEQVYTSSDGICTIEKKKSYYDVTLEYEGNDYYDVGAAYAQTILLSFADYSRVMEPYLFENIKATFQDLYGDYSAVEERVDILKSSLPEEYQREMEGFADGISGGVSGYKEDGILSYDEAMLMQIIPDALRGTACSSITVNGNKTESGERISARILDWQLGSENQICKCHCVLQMKNGDKTLTSLSVLGLLDILTAVNDDGVMAGIHDVGTSNDVSFTCENKTAYSYELRYALENFKTAREVGDYLISNCSSYTYSANILLTDRNDAFCAELAVNSSDGLPVLRDSLTKLNRGLIWDDKDMLCIVNSFAANGNSDKFTKHKSNIVRWDKYNRIFGGEEVMSLNRFKELLTCEKATEDSIVNFRSKSAVHVVIVDYKTRTIQAILPNEQEMLDNPEFIYLGEY